MNLVTVTRQQMLAVLRQLLRRREPVRLGVGVSHHAGNRERLVCPTRSGADRNFVLVIDEAFRSDAPLSSRSEGLLTVGRGSWRGQVWGLGAGGERSQIVDRLKIVGPGMHVLHLPDEGSGPPLVPERWSRTAGALGPDVWRRLTGLSYGVVGAGRTGSHLVQMLAGMGVSRLVLIDRDTLEKSNLGEMTSVTVADVGRRKCEAVAHGVSGGCSAETRIEAVPQSVTHVRALHALQGCDMLVSCVDHDGARLAATVLSTLFLKPLLDVGVGVHQGRERTRQLGVDIRLTVPGDRCLLCMGGLIDEATAVAMLRSPDTEEALYAARDWRRERAGSLGSLAGLAAALAIRLWEDFVAERLSGSIWMHAEFDTAGRLSITYPLAAPNPTCRLCRFAGFGEEGLLATRELLQGR